MAGLNHSPQAGQTLAASQPLIYANFITFIEPDFAVDHVGFNQGTDKGKHKAIHMVAGSAPTIGATEIGLYNVLDGSSLPVLHVVGPAGVDSDITTLTNANSFGSWTGNTQIASSLRFAWVQVTTGSNGKGAFDFSGIFTTSLSPYTIQATATTLEGSSTNPVSCSINITSHLNPAIGTVYAFNASGPVAIVVSIFAIGV